MTRFRYVDQGLYIRTRNATNFVKRYPNENFAKAARSNLTMLGIPFRFGSTLWRCAKDYNFNSTGRAKNETVRVFYCGRACVGGLHGFVGAA